MRKEQFKIKKAPYLIPVMAFSLFAFAFIITAVIAGSFTPPSESSAVGSTTEITVTVPDNLSLIVDNGSGGTDVSMTATHATTGTLLKSGVTVTASTNNKTGYTLTFSDVDEDNNLVEENNSTLTIPALSSSTPESSFPEDKWGYSLNSGDFSPVPLLSTPLTIEESTAPGTNSHTVDFATKISNSTPGGTYKDETIFSLVANYVPPAQATFWTATTMQEFSQETCDTVSTPSATATTIVSTSSAYTDPSTQVPERVLQDTRDNKYYIIRKLADGNCWMAQNLDIELAGKTLTNQDTDLNSKTSWTGAIAVNVGTTWSQPDYTTARYYSPSNTQTGDQYYTNGGGTSNQDGLTTWTGSFPDNLNPTPSYLVGNYYTWSAATAGSVDSSYSQTSKEAPDSICPKGWRLPPTAGNKSWYNLLTTTYSANQNSILTAPLSFVRSGGYNYSGDLYSQSTYGFYWSSVASASGASHAQGLALGTNGIGPQTAIYVSTGFSVRCVTHGTPAIQNNITSWCSAQTTPAAFTSGTAINANVPEVKMKDKRDGEEYTIRKLADGNCWMTDNLRLGKTDQTYTIDSTNSDTTTTSFTLPAAASSGTSDYDVLQVWSQNETNRQTYGNYYNWYTATAQTGTQSITSGDATGSICPKGMKLSPNAGNGSFQSLTTTYSIANDSADVTKLQGAPLNFPLAGNYNNRFYNQGLVGYYWSRTASNNGTDAHYLLFDTSRGVNPQVTNNKNLGFSVRCVTPGGN